MPVVQGWPAWAAGMRTVVFDSDQGAGTHLDCEPDHTITDFRDLLKILDLAEGSVVL